MSVTIAFPLTQSVDAPSFAAPRTFTMVADAGDVTPPNADVGAFPTVVSGVSSIRFVITYTDDGSGVDHTTITTAALSISGLVVTGVSLSPNADGASVVATFTVTTPSGSFNSSHNGIYTLIQRTGVVRDLAGNSTFAVLGSFHITLPAATRRRDGAESGHF